MGVPHGQESEHQGRRVHDRLGFGSTIENRRLSMGACSLHLISTLRAADHAKRPLQRSARVSSSSARSLLVFGDGEQRQVAEHLSLVGEERRSPRRDAGRELVGSVR